MKDKREHMKEKCKEQDCCKKVYQAFDGEIFDTKEECKVYTDKPRIFKVAVKTLTYLRNVSFKETYYLDYAIAKDMEDSLIKHYNKENEKVETRAVYSVEFEQITFEEYNNNLMVFEDLEVKQELTKEKQSKVISLWENIKSYFKNRDSDKENT